MRIFHHFNDLPVEARGAAVAVGNFDGVHLGHRAVIGEAGRIAHSANLPWAVLSFEPHPRRLFQPDAAPFRLTPLPAKARQIAAQGVDHMIVINFDLEFSKRGAQNFVEEVLVKGLGVRHVVCGYDFVFGHRRQGDGSLLLALGRTLGFDFTTVHALGDPDGGAYSATRVRDALAAGDAPAAARILGRPFEIEGEVVAGEKRGRALGFPTANMRLGEYHRPAGGVYAVRASADDGATWLDGVAYLGTRPTFDGVEVLLETHLFDFSGDLYGRTLRVALVERLRPDQAFAGPEALKAQMIEDRRLAEIALAAKPAKIRESIRR